MSETSQQVVQRGFRWVGGYNSSVVYVAIYRTDTGQLYCVARGIYNNAQVLCAIIKDNAEQRDLWTLKDPRGSALDDRFGFWDKLGVDKYIYLWCEILIQRFKAVVVSENC